LIMRVVLTNNARISIKEAARYVKLQFGAKRSNQFRDEVFKAIDNLAVNPNLGHITDFIPDNESQYRILVINRINSLIYYVEGNDLVISYCWDNRQNPETMKDKI